MEPPAMPRTVSLLQHVEIASPCPARWEDMVGDERVRFCDECRLNVYDIAAMTEVEAEALIREKSGHLCLRLYRRDDGTILTRDCPVGLAAARRRLRRLITGAAALLSLVAGGFALARSGADRNASYSSLGDVPGVRTVKRWLDPAPPAVTPVPPGAFALGRIAVPPPPNKTTTTTTTTSGGSTCSTGG
jgi:hypothetical protein